MKPSQPEQKHGGSKLPAGWVECCLGDILRVIRGVTYKKENAAAQEKDGFVPILRATNINDGLTFADLVYVPPTCVSQDQMLQAGDVVIAASSGSKSVVGKAALFKGEWRGSFGAFCYGLRPAPEMDAGYIADFLRTAQYRNYVSTVAAGVNINNLRREHIERFTFPLAPRPEQSRIVSEIEKHFSRLDAGVAALKRVGANLRRYKASVLKAACEGRLTAAWRAAHPNVEPASELLKRILRDRRRRWEESELAKLRARGKPPKDDRWKERYEEPRLPRPDALPELPTGWAYSPLDPLVAATNNAIKRGPFGSAIKKELFVSVGFKVYEQKHAIYGDFTLGEYYIDQHKFDELRAFEVRPGDLIISCSGTVGRTAIVPLGAQPGIINQALLKLTFDADVILARYFEIVFAAMLDTLLRQNVRGSAMANITGVKELKQIAWPLPPLDEQREIIKEVDRLFSLGDEVANDLGRVRRRATHLRQSILRNAFEGKLVEQDPHDEPASVLLERIRALRTPDAMQQVHASHQAARHKDPLRPSRTPRSTRR